MPFPFAALIPLITGAVGASQKNTKNNQLLANTSVENAFAPLTKAGTTKFSQLALANPTSDLINGATGSVNSFAESRAAGANAQNGLISLALKKRKNGIPLTDEELKALGLNTESSALPATSFSSVPGAGSQIA